MQNSPTFNKKSPASQIQTDLQGSHRQTALFKKQASRPVAALRAAKKKFLQKQHR
jgi:hypothetical protein